MTRAEQIDAVKETAKVAGDRMVSDYSGRGMFGATCFGVICSDPHACIEEAATWGLRNGKTDNMGKDYIVYWPSITGD